MFIKCEQFWAIISSPGVRTLNSLPPFLPSPLPLLECLPQNYLNSLVQAASAAWAMGQEPGLWPRGPGSVFSLWCPLQPSPTHEEDPHPEGLSDPGFCRFHVVVPWLGPAQVPGVRPKELMASVGLCRISCAGSTEFQNRRKTANMLTWGDSRCFRPVSHLHGCCHLSLTIISCRF